MQTILAIANQKGGVGKTTTTINLGSALQREGYKVLLVDLDPQANTTSGIGGDKNHPVSIYDLLFDPSLIEQGVQEVNGISVIGSNPNLAAAEVELVSEFNRERRLSEVLSKTAFDYVLIDCPPSLGILTINALTAASGVVIPVQSEYYALEGLTQLVDSIQRVRVALNQQLIIAGILMTMVDDRTSLSREVVDQVKKHFGELVFEQTVPRNVRLAEAPSHGVSVFDHDKWSKGARSYKKFAKELTDRIG